jgi:hypothetical protein
MPNREGRPRRKPARVAVTVLAIVVAIILLPLLCLLAVNALDRRDPLSYLPAHPDAYASVGSLSETLARLQGLRAADELLSGPGEAGLRALLVTARTSPLLSSGIFRALAARPAYFTVSGDQVLAAADLGILGAAARVLPIVGPFLEIKGLAYERSGGVSRILVGKAPGLVRIAIAGRVLVASTSGAAIDAALARSSAQGAATTTDPGQARNLKIRAKLEELEFSAPSGGVIRLIVDLRGFSSRLAASDASAAALLRDLAFPREAIVDLDIADERVSLEASLPLVVADKGLGEILSRRSGVPAVLPLLPADTAYAGLASAGRPAALLPTAMRYLGGTERAAYEKAEAACRSALGVGFDELLYSWAGDEFGAFGLARFPEAVFFVRIEDEPRRKAAFDRLASSAFVGEELGTVVDGMRIPRIVLPWYVRDVLSLAGASVPEPYWISERGFLFVSTSAEALRAVAKAAAEGEALPRTEGFRNLVGRSGSDAAAAVYYSLDRSSPFFLRGQGAVERVLRLYRKGLLLVRTGPSGSGPSGLRVSLLAARGEREIGLRELPGFPFPAGGRLSGPPLVLGSGSGAVIVYPLSGGRIVARPFARADGGAGGAATEAKLDGDASLLAAAGQGGAAALWALTKQGTVYRFDSSLEHLRPFPHAASARPSSAPALSPPASPGGEAGLAFGAKGGGIVIVDAAGSETRIALPGEGALLSPPAFSAHMIAAYPKAFDGSLYLLDEKGAPLPGWPLPAGGIGFGSPLFVPLRQGPAIAFLTQSGELTLRDTGGSPLAGFPTKLGGSFAKAPVSALDGSSLYAIDAEGLIVRVSPSGTILGERREAALKGGETSLLVAALSGDDREIVFAAGAGNSVYAYSADLVPLPGFPAKGAWPPCLADLDGDGSPEFVTGGLDDAIHAYSLR